MVIATGFFDGVHLGHRLVISQLVDYAEKMGQESMVVTFWPHPRNVLQKDARVLRLLSTLEEKKRILHELGVGRVEVLPFTREFSRLTTREYFRDIIVGKFGDRSLEILESEPEKLTEIKGISASKAKDILKKDLMRIYVL